RNENTPVQKHVAQVDRDQGPAVGGHQAFLWVQIVSVNAEVVERLGFGIQRRRLLVQFVEDVLQSLIRVFVFSAILLAGLACPVNPCRQPTADEAPTRNGRQVIKLVEQTAPRQSLQDSQVESCAAHAAAG